MMRRLTAAALAAVGMLGVCAAGQTLSAQGGAAVPRTADGKPDFTGVWQVLNTAWYDIEDHHAEPGVPPGQSVVVGGEIPYQPWALEQKRKNWEARATDDTSVKCYMPGVPRLMYAPYPFQIVQTPEKVNVISEWNRTVRHIYTNGTPHPEGPIEWWMGDSRGRWEGDTLVVSVMHVHDNRTWFDKAGNFYSDQARLEERFTYIDKDHLNYEVTVTDPKVFTRPWKLQMPLYRRIEPQVRVMEYYCYGFYDVFQLPADRR